jgi:predicted nuclease of predicted toxin-antitoxin system
MQFLANENIPIASIHKLRHQGYDVVAVIEIMPGAKDRQVMEKANRESRITLTFDRDYGELVFRFKLPLPAGVVYLRFIPVNPEEPANYILDLLENKNLVLEGKFTVGRRNRVRQQPLGKKLDKLPLP